MIKFHLFFGRQKMSLHLIDKPTKFNLPNLNWNWLLVRFDTREMPWNYLSRFYLNECTFFSLFGLSLVWIHFICGTICIQWKRLGWALIQSFVFLVFFFHFHWNHTYFCLNTITKSTANIFPNRKSIEKNWKFLFLMHFVLLHCTFERTVIYNGTNIEYRFPVSSRCVVVVGFVFFLYCCRSITDSTHTYMERNTYNRVRVLSFVEYVDVGTNGWFEKRISFSMCAYSKLCRFVIFTSKR